MSAIGTAPSSSQIGGLGSGGGSLRPLGNRPVKKKASGKNCFILVAAAALFGGLWWLGNGSSHYTWPLTIASVYAHEMGHLLTALLMGAKVESLHLSLMPDITLGAEGFVRYSIAHGSRIRQALISGAGCYSQVLTGMIFVLAARHPRVSKALLIVCAALCAFSLIYADSLVTYAVVIVLGVIAGLAAKFLKGGLLQLFMAFSGFAIAAAMLENWRYLFSTDGSDMQHVSQYLFLPTWFWGGIAFLIGVATILLGIWTFIMQETSDEPAQPMGLPKR